MTVILIDLRHDADGGPVAVPEDAYVQWIPTARRAGPGDSVVLPATVHVPLVDGVAAPDIPPSGDGWAWRTIERMQGGAERTVLVPEAGPVSYRTLVDVDPATLDPDPTPGAAFLAVHRPTLTLTDYLALTPEEQAAPVLYLIAQ